MIRSRLLGPWAVRVAAFSCRPSGVEILLDATILRWFLNDAGVSAGVADEGLGAFGPIALYVGAPIVLLVATFCVGVTYLQQDRLH